MRNAECGVDRTTVEHGGQLLGSNLARSIPHSAFPIPHWGGARVGVDVGGTFTDLVALTQDGTIEVRKVVTTPVDPTLALFEALDALTVPIDVLIHGTTIATNALLERRG